MAPHLARRATGSVEAVLSLCDRVPEANPNVVEVMVIVKRTIHIGITRVNTAQEVPGEVRARRQPGNVYSHAWTELDKVGPVLIFYIGCVVGIEQELRGEVLSQVERASSLVDGVEQQVFVEPADVGGVARRLVEES